MASFVRECRLGCGRQVRFHRTVASREAGGKPKYMPLDPDPHPEGSVALDGFGDAQPVGVGHPLHEGELYRTHFETCEPYLADQRARAGQLRLGQEVD